MGQIVEHREELNQDFAKEQAACPAREKKQDSEQIATVDSTEFATNSITGPLVERNTRKVVPGKLIISGESNRRHHVLMIEQSTLWEKA
ncbi:hypothetical protein BLNAU_20317 [Blattamonas nauphoetae]|uniref:Transposase n=1 Tax=Blattamonas nauphoetae TaxID=2049346 RepID=A0ABQ9X0B8_9EUKA|nr:hypothetical protein BLNAU_20317 [Blattamonas nauphoetae]